MADDLDGVIYNIRAVIGSSKDPVQLWNLAKDYETLEGSPIPFRSFNFKSLESFLQTIPSLRVTGSGRDAYVEAATITTSQHIANLIAKQKTSRPNGPASRRGGGYRYRGSGSNRPTAPKFPFANYAVTQTDYSRYKKIKNNYEDCKWQPAKVAPGNVAYNHNMQSSALKESNVSGTVLNSGKENKVAESDKGKHTKEHLKTSNHTDTLKKSNDKVPPNLTVKVESNDRRQVTIAEPSGYSNQTQSPTSPNIHQAPQRFLKNQSSSLSELSATEIISITSDIEETLFLEPAGATYPKFIEQKLQEIEPNIVTGGKPSQLVATGRAREQAAKSQMNGLKIQLENNTFINEPVGVPKYPKLVGIVPLPDEVNIHKNIFLLQHYVSLNKWKAPEYVSFARKAPVTHKKIFSASVKVDVGDNKVQQYNGYPGESESEIVAKGYAAKVALHKLKLIEEKVKLIKPITTTDTNIINDRISKIVSRAYHGMFAQKVQEDYENVFGEQLSLDWLDTVSLCPSVSVEYQHNQAIITHNTVVDPNLEAFPMCVPPKLHPPQEHTWDVFVTSALSTSQVWLRLIGDDYSGKYEQLLSKMDSYYLENSSKCVPPDIQYGHYAANSTEGWHRVCVTTIDNDKKRVSAFLIDHGDIDIYNFTDLYLLPPEFCSLPPQAVQCSLADMDGYSEVDLGFEILQTCGLLIGKTLIAEVKNNNGNFSITLYDTSGEDDVNLNRQLKHCFVAYYTKCTPQLPKEGLATDVIVSHITKRGEIYIQIPNNDRLMEIEFLMSSLSLEEIKKHKLTSYRQVKLKKIYLAHYTKENTWHRAVVTATPSVQQNKIAVCFIDFGNSETVTFDGLANLDTLPPILVHLPPQALKVVLNNLPPESLSSDQITKLHSLLVGDDKVILLKLISMQKDLPLVDMYYKDDAGTGCIVSVNLTISEGIKQKSNKKPLILSLANGVGNHDPTYKDLKNPNFDANVQAIDIIMPVTPGNFTFQLRKYKKDLESLMIQLQHYYDTMKLPELQEAEIISGCLYACLRLDDNKWYRVCVSKVSTLTVAVYYCDYGEVEIVEPLCLRRLESDFCKVPFMAIKGKLYGVKPVHVDWAVEDTFRFTQLVKDKTLASFVKDIDNDSDNPMEMVITLYLVDSNPNQEVIISTVLCNEGHALPTQ